MRLSLVVLCAFNALFSISGSFALVEHANRALKPRPIQRAYHPLPIRDESATNSSSSSPSIIRASSTKECGDVGASMDITTTTGPNGNIRWLNCGLSPAKPDSGWTPPPASLSDIAIYAPGLAAAANQTSSPFNRCKQYVDDFEIAGAMYNVSAFFLAAFALQESSCNANAVADAGTYGLMQLSQDKCVDVDCLDPTTNIQIGAAYLRKLMDDHPNNLFAVIGAWNGWYPGMTYNDVIAHRSYCCYCQQNLDYLHQFMNGWLQNRDAYANPRMGQFFNLDICAQSGDGNSTDDGSGFPKIFPGAAPPAHSLSLPWSLAFLGLVAGGIIGLA